MHTCIAALNVTPKLSLTCAFSPELFASGRRDACVLPSCAFVASTNHWFVIELSYTNGPYSVSTSGVADTEKRHAITPA